MAKLPRVTGKMMVALLKIQGFTVVRVRGSHHVLQKGDLRTTIPVHGNRDLKIGTLRKILRDIDLSPREYEELL